MGDVIGERVRPAQSAGRGMKIKPVGTSCNTPRGATESVEQRADIRCGCQATRLTVEPMVFMFTAFLTL